MARRRFIQIDGVLVEVEPDYQSTGRGNASNQVLWNDRAYQDMGDSRFASRTQHREYMKRNNLTTVDDMHGTWKKAERQRLDLRAGIDPTRKQDMVKAVEKLQQGYKPHLPTDVIPRR